MNKSHAAPWLAALIVLIAISVAAFYDRPHTHTVGIIEQVAHADPTTTATRSCVAFQDTRCVTWQDASTTTSEAWRLLVRKPDGTKTWVDISRDDYQDCATGDRWTNRGCRDK